MLIWLYFIWNHSKISAFEGLQEVVLSAHEAKLLICLMGTYAFVDDEYTFDLTHTVRLVVLVKGDHIRRGHCFSKKKVLERTNGVKQWHGWRLPLQTESNQVKGAEWSWIFLCYFSFLRKKSSVYRYR